MSQFTPSLTAVDQSDIEQVPTSTLRQQLARVWQRGMATAEYAVGILAAVALALVLLHIFTDNSFFEVLLKFVIDLIGKAGALI